MSPYRRGIDPRSRPPVYCGRAPITQSRSSIMLAATLIFALSPGIVAGMPDAVLAPQSRITRILFIGNSYTYFNNLPEMVAKLAAAGGQGEVVYQMLAPGGTRLKDHWDSESERKVF